MDIINDMFGIIKTMNPLVEQLLTKYNTIIKEEASFKVLTRGINVYEKNFNELQSLNDNFFTEKNKFDEFGTAYFTVLPDNIKEVFEAYGRILMEVAATATIIEKIKSTIVYNMDTPWRILKQIGRMYKENRQMFAKLRIIHKLQKEYNKTLNLVLK